MYSNALELPDGRTRPAKWQLDRLAFFISESQPCPFLSPTESPSSTMAKGHGDAEQPGSLLVLRLHGLDLLDDLVQIGKTLTLGVGTSLQEDFLYFGKPAREEPGGRQDPRP